jgi:hypothetical protein
VGRDGDRVAVRVVDVLLAALGILAVLLYRKKNEQKRE